MLPDAYPGGFLIGCSVRAPTITIELKAPQYCPMRFLAAFQSAAWFSPPSQLSKARQFAALMHYPAACQLDARCALQLQSNKMRHFAAAMHYSTAFQLAV
jgi:hypothetical protein